MSRLERAALTARTVRHLRPRQLAHRVRLRTQRSLITRAPVAAARLLTPPLPTQPPAWPTDFVPLDGRVAGQWPTLDELAQGRITLLGQQRLLGDWRSTEPPQLWRYHLHYWDWAWGLAADPDRDRSRALFAKLVQSWCAQTRFGQWDEWSPYVASLRAWSWCGQYEPLARGGEIEPELVRLLTRHAGFLRAHLELDVGGNHLVKNLKALIGLAIFLGDQSLLARSLRRLAGEVEHQVLPDGGHFERAPAYHCQVLGDLIDLCGLLGDASPDWMDEAVARMRRWLGQVLLPDGTVPLLNDGFPVAPETLTLLQPGPPAPDGMTLLADSGLAILRKGATFVLADIGLPCPPELPAHAHADTFGFLMYQGVDPLVTEAGTSTYEAGAIRQYERSSAAHSTVQIDGTDSTEVWGAFRAARRARPTIVGTHDDGVQLTLTARHDGYARLPGAPLHTRSWTVTAGSVRILDEVVGTGQHDIVARLHGTPLAAVNSTEGWRECVVHHAVGWEKTVEATALEQASRVTLPWQCEVTLTPEEKT